LTAVITGLVPVISIVLSAAPFSIGMAGTRPAMTGGGGWHLKFTYERLVSLGFAVPAVLLESDKMAASGTFRSGRLQASLSP
jgi:hypothetical protein